MDAIHAAQENGRTMPVVPSTDKPPRIPSLGFIVLRASSAPPSIETVISTSPTPPFSWETSSIAVRIIWRGTGLMAGSPGGIGRPGLVTVPTPSPALKITPEPGGNRLTVALTKAPWVTSGSSPASLMMAADADFPESVCRVSAKDAVPPLGRVISTGSGKSPVKRA